MLNGDRSVDESSEEEKEYLNTETKRNAKLICILLRGRREGEGWRNKREKRRRCATLEFIAVARNFEFIGKSS